MLVTWVGASLLRTALPTEEDRSFPSEGPVPSVSHRSTSASDELLHSTDEEIP